jgi:cellulose synthase/poly-beta-1,6-N-acetylglucosamine synthase-like glycosyltransferase
VRACRGLVVAFTDADAQPEPGWLEALVRPLLAADRDPKLIGVGGPVEPVFMDDTPAWFRAMVMKKATHFLGPRHDLGPEPRDYSMVLDDRTGAPLGANCAYRRELFPCYGFDRDLGPNHRTGLRGGEDTLFARILLRDGYRLRYCPEARVRHPVLASRATEANVLRGHYVQGVEWARMQRALALPLPSLPRLRFEHWRMRFRLLRKRISGRADADRRRNLLAKAEFRRGLFEEARRGRRASSTPRD